IQHDGGSERPIPMSSPVSVPGPSSSSSIGEVDSDFHRKEASTTVATESSRRTTPGRQSHRESGKTRRAGRGGGADRAGPPGSPSTCRPVRGLPPQQGQEGANDLLAQQTTQIGGQGRRGGPAAPGFHQRLDLVGKEVQVGQVPAAAEV